MSTIPEALITAIDHHRAGRLQEAESIYRQILQTDPSHVETWRLLGTLAAQAGQPEGAIECVQRALQLNPGLAETHNTLGNIFRAQGQLAAAVECFQQAVALQPGNAVLLYNLGNALQTQGRPAEAIDCYQRALQLNPNFTEAHNNLGHALKVQGHLAEAIACFERALQLNPQSAEATINLGNVWREQGQIAEAIGCYRRVLQFHPDSLEALYNLGSTLSGQGELAEAIACYERAVQLHPHNAQAHSHLGMLLQRQGRTADAIICFQRVLELAPDDVGTLNHLGLALREQGRLPEAVACFQRALQLQPNEDQLLNNLGLSLHEQGQLDAAIICFQSGLKLNPSGAELHYNLGNSFFKDGRHADAVACYQRALQINPNFIEAHNNLGNVLKEQRKPGKAIAYYRRAVELMPDLAELHSNLGAALVDDGQLPESLVRYRRALELKPDHVQAHSNLLFAMHFDPDCDPRTIYEEHCRFQQQHAAALEASIQPHPNDRSPHRRLRVGYVSPDFRNHSQAYFTVPLFAAHDHERFEIFCYADVPRPDSITARLRSHADIWRSITGFTDQQVAEQVRNDRIDILVDLTMHLANNRALAFARKPAPVQLCWLAYQGTTGLSAIDYRLTDPHVDPPGLDDRFYSEESIRLPDSFWCYDPLTSDLEVSALPALASGHVTFGSFNNFCKINPEVLKLWARVLKAVPGSQLVLQALSEGACERTLHSLSLEGIAAERIEFVPFLPRAKYLELYHRVDIGLDTFPYTGQTTSLDAYWLGVPVVTITGQTAASRAGASLLLNLGLPELIAQTPDQFVQITAELAGDLPRLAQLRTGLRERLENSPLMDAPRFARNVEAAYRSMWQRWCAD